MKIGIAIGTMQGGGAQRVVSILSKYFVEKGYLVNIITTSDAIVEYEIDNRIKIFSLVSKTDLIVVKQIVCFTKLYSHIKKEKYDVIFSFLPMTCIYVALCKVLGCNFKMISSERMDPAQDPVSKILRIIRDWSYEKSDYNVFQTIDAKNYFNYKIQEKSTIIFNPINEKIPFPTYDNREKKIVTAVRLEKQKNVEMLIDAFAIFNRKHPDYRLEIYGQGSLENAVRKKIFDYGLEKSVLLEGFKQNIYECMKNASFFVLSSDYEGVSNSMLEALCLGLPVVSTDHPIGGASMFITDSQNGFLSPVGDAVKLANNMHKVVCLSQEQYSEMCKNAAEVRSKLETASVCYQWEKVMKKC